jgi:hypothetical protein
MAFKKNDQDKLRWDKFPWDGAQAVLKIMHYGAQKYEWDNWKSAGQTDKDRMVGAAFRHLIEHARGGHLDPESGYPHIWHAACNLLFLAHFITEEVDACK